MEQIANESQFLTLAFNYVATVSWCVPVGRKGMHAWDYCFAACERRESSCLLIGGDIGGGVIVKRFQVFRRLLDALWIGNQVDILLIHEQGRLGKGHFAVDRQASDMIRVDVGDQNRVDLFGLVSRGLEILQKMTSRRPHDFAGPRVDQHELGVRIDEKGIDRSFDFIGEEVLFENGADTFLG